jgi:hypothetical protein
MVKNSMPSTKTSVTDNAKISSSDDNVNNTASQRDAFVTMAISMSWKLAIVVLIPVFAGSRLDKSMHTGTTWTFVGLGVALIGSIAVMWQTMQVANKLPVPKLTDAQKRAIKKSYEEEDEE